MSLAGTYTTHQRSQFDCTAIRNSIVVPPVFVPPVTVVVLPVAIVGPPVALLLLAVVMPPVAIVVPPVALLPLAVAVPPVVVPSTMRGQEGGAMSGQREMMMRQPAGAMRQQEAARRDDETTRGRRVERRRNNGHSTAFDGVGDGLRQEDKRASTMRGREGGATRGQ